jgi:hypothetical protein
MNHYPKKHANNTMSTQDHANNTMPNTDLSISDKLMEGDIIKSDDHDLKLQVVCASDDVTVNNISDEVTGCDDIQVKIVPINAGVVNADDYDVKADLKETLLSGLNSEYRKKYDEGRLSYKQALNAQRLERCEELRKEGGKDAVEQLVTLPKVWGDYDTAMKERKEAAGLPDDFKVPKKLMKGNSHVKSRLDPDFLPFVPETKQERDDQRLQVLKVTSERLAGASPSRLRDLLSISGVDPDTKLVDIDMDTLGTIHESLNTDIGAFACHEIDYLSLFKQSAVEYGVTTLHRRLNLFVDDVRAVLGEHSRGLVPTVDKTMKLFCILLAGVLEPGVMDEKKQLAMKSREYRLTEIQANIVSQELRHNGNRLATSGVKSLIFLSYMKLVDDIEKEIRRLIKLNYNRTSFTLKRFP